MRIYLAGSSDPEQMERVERWTKALHDVAVPGRPDGRSLFAPRVRAWELVATWVANIRAVGRGNPRNATPRDRMLWAAQCLAEVRSSDVLWLLVPPAPIASAGCWADLACAYESGKPVVSSGDTRRSVFTALGREFERDEDAFEHLEQWRRAERG